MRHGAFEIDVIDPIARGIGAGELRERTGGRAVGQPEIVGETLGAQRQAAIAGVLQLFDAQREGEIDRAGRDRIDGGAERLRTGRAHVLDARHRNAFQAERMRERQCAVADIDIVERIAHPRRLNLTATNLRVGQRLLERVDHQVFGPATPVLAERRAAHAHDRDFVFDATRHGLQALEGRTPLWRRLPEIGAEAAPGIMRLDPQPHPYAVADREPARVGVGELHHDSSAVVELREPEPERRVRREIEPVRGDGDDGSEIIGQPNVLPWLGAVGVGAHGNAALGKLHVALGVATADEADHIPAVTLQHRRLRLLLEFRTHAPVEIQGSRQAQEANVVGKRETGPHRFGRLVRPRHRSR